MEHVQCQAERVSRSRKFGALGKTRPLKLFCDFINKMWNIHRTWGMETLSKEDPSLVYTPYIITEFASARVYSISAEEA